MRESLLNKLNLVFSEIIAMLCDKTDDQIILATLNGEAGGESSEGQQAVRNVISNRTTGPKYYRKDDLLGYSGSSREVEVCLSPNQFSVWNGISKCPDFKAKYDKIMRGAKITKIPAVNHSVFTNGTGLTEEQAKKIYLYCNPKTATSTEKWVVLTKKQSAANPNKKSWSIKTVFNGENVKITFIRIGNHVFLHGLK